MIKKHEPPHRYARLIACIKFQRRRLLGAVIYQCDAPLLFQRNLCASARMAQIVIEAAR